MPSKFDPQRHHRHSIRLPNYDYSQPGAYFITIVAWHRECLFGEVVRGEMKLNRYGEIVNYAWFDLPHHFRHVALGAFIIMSVGAGLFWATTSYLMGRLQAKFSCLKV